MSWRARIAGPPGAAAIALLAALVYRGIYAAELRAMPVFLAPVLDGAAHLEWARGVLAGTWPGAVAFFRAPGYPYALAGALAVLGDDPARVALVQLYTGAIVPGLVALLAGRLFGRGAAWVAGLGAAVYPTLAFFDAQLLASALAVPLGTAATLLSVEAIRVRAVPERTSPVRAPVRSRRSVGWAAAALWSLGAVVRPPLLVAGLALPLLLRESHARRALLVLVVLSAPLAVTLRNAAVGDPVFIASQGGLNLYLGNGPHADGHAATFPDAPGAMGYRMLDASKAIAERDEGHVLRSSGVSRYWARRTVAAVVSDPLRSAALLGRKALLFLHSREIPNNHDPVLFAESLPALRLPAWGLWLPWALLGTWGAWQRAGGRFVVVALGAVALGCVVFFVNARFRLPAVPLILALGGGGAMEMALALRARKPARVVPAVALVAAGVILTNVNPYGIPREAAPTSYVLLAEAEFERGEPVRALRWVERGLEREPGLYTARLAQVDLLRGMRRYGEAMQVAERVLEIAPDDPAMLRQSALLLDATGHPNEALARMEHVLRLEPSFPGAAIDRDVLRVHAGRVEEAVADLRRIASSGSPVDAERARLVLGEVESGALAPRESAVPERAP